MTISNYLENVIINHLLRNQAYAPPATIYASLHTGDPGETGANEAAGGTYARQAVVLSADNPTANTGALNFTGMPVADVMGLGIWDAAAAGNHMWNGPLVGGTFTALAGDDTFTAAAHGMSNGAKVAFHGASLPTGISAWTTYYVISAAANTFQVSATPGGAAVNLTADGSGSFIKVKGVNAGDTFQVPVGDLDVSVD